MKTIVAYQTGHDSSIAALTGGKLVASIEGEKNSNARFYMQPTLDNAFEWLHRLNKIQAITPDVICILGWNANQHEARDRAGEYFGLDYKEIIQRKIFGNDVDFFYSTHEKAHIFLSYALSPFPQGMPVYCLTWEGAVSALYRVDQSLNIEKVRDVIPYLGSKYSFLFVLAGLTDSIDLDAAGKIMALAAYAREKKLDKYQKVIDYLLFEVKTMGFTRNDCLILKTKLQRIFGNVIPFDKGATDQEFKELCWAFQERVIQVFLESARGLDKIPLLISGGCGLNCYWNQRIKNSGVFEDVFIPPCTNDSGVAIGLAAEAQFHYTGIAKVSWDVYAGEPFEDNFRDSGKFSGKPLCYQEVAQQLSQGGIIAWIQGRYEIGPRALCNRSVLAAPFLETTRRRLNAIKSREPYRPIAPVCLEEDVKQLFRLDFASPYMLYFSEVLATNLKAVTHVDNTARVQTVNKMQNEPMHLLLSEFKKMTGYGVLCNTSLNYKGQGFINNAESAFQYASEKKLDGVVIGNTFYKKI